jgi:hypothetical protein
MKAARKILPLSDDYDPGDIKGWALGWMFPVAEVLHITGADIPDEWGFSPSPFLEGMNLREYADSAESWRESEVVDALAAGMSTDELVYVGRVVDRYMSAFIRGTDRDY